MLHFRSQQPGSFPGPHLRALRYFGAPSSLTFLSLLPVSGTVKARSGQLDGAAQAQTGPMWAPVPSWTIVCPIVQGWFSFSGITQDWDSRLELTYWFGVTQTVYLGKTSPKTSQLSPIHPNGSPLPVIKTIHFKFKWANIFTGAIDHCIFLSLCFPFTYVEESNPINICMFRKV